MDFMQSNTLINLGRSFAGESQAHMRYQLYAKRAIKDGYYCLGKLIEEIAYNELQHAKIFIEHINQNAPNLVKNLHLDAGYPFEFATTAENLAAAEEGENAENTLIYPDFGKIAQDEGFAPVAQSYQWIATIEGQHKKIFETLRNKFTSNSLYSSPTEITWECSVCGHRATGLSPWTVCPVCQHPQGYVKIPVQA